MEIKVGVFKRSGRKFFEAQWIDPLTGRKRTRSTKKTSKRDAERFAAKLEHELLHGPDSDLSKVSWREFRERYETEHASTLAPKTRQKIGTALNSFEDYVSPAWLANVTANVVSRYSGRIRREGLSEATVKGYLAHLQAALRWANRVGILASVPHIEMPRRVNKSKGRPLTEEEFDRMIRKAATILSEERAEPWRFLMRGLWWSGLRLGESLALSWTSDEMIMADFSHARPMFRIRAEAEKGRKDRYLPMAPEFARLLSSVQKRKRRGYVFKGLDLPAHRYVGRIPVHAASKVIAAIGKEAGVVVGKKQGSKSSRFATAHDFRRAFGFRWSMRVLPPVLTEMMRHESIQTTMQYYVGRNAEAAADAAWRAFEEKAHEVTNTFANTFESEGETDPESVS